MTAEEKAEFRRVVQSYLSRRAAEGIPPAVPPPPRAQHYDLTLLVLRQRAEFDVNELAAQANPAGLHSAIRRLRLQALVRRTKPGAGGISHRLCRYKVLPAGRRYLRRIERRLGLVPGGKAGHAVH